jgi:hypothetical protein
MTLDKVVISFLEITPKAQSMKEKHRQTRLHQGQYQENEKNTHRKGENYFQIISDRGLALIIYKVFLLLSNEKSCNSIKIGKAVI